MNHHDTLAMTEALYQLRLRVEAWTEAAAEDRDAGSWPQAIVKDCARLVTQGPHAYLAHVRAGYQHYLDDALNAELINILGGTGGPGAGSCT